MEESTGAKYPIYDVTDSAGRVHSIHTAAQFGDRAYIVSALEKSLDADVNGLDNVGRTALHWATENGKKEVVRTLLDYAADPRIPEAASFRTPLFLAVKNNDVDMLNDLVERLTHDEVNGVCNQPDRQENHIEALKWLMNKGARYEQLT